MNVQEKLEKYRELVRFLDSGKGVRVEANIPPTKQAEFNALWEFLKEDAYMAGKPTAGTAGPTTVGT